MKKVKKLLSLVLCLCMMCVSAVPTYAHTGATIQNANKIYNITNNVTTIKSNLITVYQGTYITSGYIKELKSVKSVYSKNSKIVPAKFKWKASDFSKISVENWTKTFLYAKGVGSTKVKVTTKANKSKTYTIKVIKKPALKSMVLSYINGKKARTLKNGQTINLRKGSRVVILATYYPVQSKINMRIYTKGKKQTYYWDKLNRKLYVKGTVAGKTRLTFKDKYTGKYKYMYINVVN